MEVRGRFGVVALALLCYNALVSSWDWYSRLHGLDPYFGAKQNTALGHFLSVIILAVSYLSACRDIRLNVVS